MKQFVIRMGILLLLAVSIAQAQVTVGMDFATTGPLASIGTEFQNTVTLLAPPVIAGQKVRYVYYDDASDPTKAVQNVKRMISEDNIDILLGPSGSPITLAVIDTIAAAKVPMLSLSSASAIVLPMDEKRRWAFKAVANDDVFVNMMVKHMLTKGVKTISIIAVGDAYGDAWVGVTKRIANEKGIKILTVERFDRNDPSTAAQALHAIKDRPDAVLVIAVGTVAVTPHRALKELGYKGLIYQSSGAASYDFLRLGGKFVEGGYLVQSPALVPDQLPNGYPTKKLAVEFLKDYESKYGSRSYFGEQMRDELMLVENAITVALKSKARPGTEEFREAVRTALENTKGLVGATAIFNMSPGDHSGVNELGASVMKIENGTWKLDQVADFK